MATIGMRAGSLLLALVVCLSLVALDARPSYACSCVSQPLRDSVDGADAIFSGEVQSIDEDAVSSGGGMAAPGRISFGVQDSWKGVAAESVSIYGQGDGVNCYDTFVEGETYLVYASHAEGKNDALLDSGLCGATKPLAGAEADLQTLGPPGDGLPETGGPPLPTTDVLAAAAALLVSAGLVLRWARNRDARREHDG